MDDTRITSTARRPLQRQRRQKRSWSKTKRAKFLDMLALTCNVRLACAEAGAAPSSAYSMRRIDGEFAGLWREAMLAGYERLETELLQRALQSINDIVPGDGGEELVATADAAVEKMDIKTILNVLAQRRVSLESAARPGRRDARLRVATEEETNAALLKKLTVLEKQVRERI